jgi:proline dehydrogenase
LYYQEALTVGTVLTAKEYIRHKSYKISSLQKQTNNGKMKEPHQQIPEKSKARN